MVGNGSASLFHLYLLQIHAKFEVNINPYLTLSPPPFYSFFFSWQLGYFYVKRMEFPHLIRTVVPCNRTLTLIVSHHPFHQEVWCKQRVTYFIVIYRFCCLSGLFSFIWLVIITLTLRIFEKHSDIVKGDRDNNEEVLHYKICFQSFGWQYQGVLQTRVTLSRLVCIGVSHIWVMYLVIMFDYVKNEKNHVLNTTGVWC